MAVSIINMIFRVDIDCVQEGVCYKCVISGINVRKNSLFDREKGWASVFYNIA